LHCGKTLGFLQDLKLISPLEPKGHGQWRALHKSSHERLYRKCRNYEEASVCNWMVATDETNLYCRSCRLNQIIPNLAESKNLTLWRRIERAKRHLIYTLLELGLPIVDRTEDPQHGLAFEFLADPDTSTEFYDDVGKLSRVMTGHHDGTITINIAEADPSAREEMREKMNEQYRTLLGHFRHEIGHYYWRELVEGTHWLNDIRALFGDERGNYEEALERYYAEGPRNDWPDYYISAYASAHPWEDWAETWAHYLHMIDTLETAHDFGFMIAGRSITHPHDALKKGIQYAFDPRVTFDILLEDWVNLTIAMNALNRSMGLPDAYPFVLSQPVAEKLRVIHRLIKSERE
jgi:hypothetical protein